MNKIDCTGIYNKLKEDIIADIDNMGITPILNIYQGEDDYGSNIYVKLKQKTGEDVGIKVNVYDAHEAKPNWEVESLRWALQNKVPIINGAAIAQLPMAKCELYKFQDCMNDADYLLNPGYTIKKIMFENTYGIELPATVKAVMAIIDNEFPDGIAGKKVAIVGCRSKTVGVFLHPVLTKMDATVSTYHSKSIIKDGEFEDMDIVISTVGSCGGISQRHFGNKTGCVCIDVGVARGENGKTIGDFNIDIRDKQKYTPYVNGVGLLTRIFLMQSVIFKYALHGVDYIDENYKYQSSAMNLLDKYAERKGNDDWGAMVATKRRVERSGLLYDLFGDYEENARMPYTTAGQF